MSWFPNWLQVPQDTSSYISWSYISRFWMDEHIGFVWNWSLHIIGFEKDHRKEKPYKPRTPALHLNSCHLSLGKLMKLWTLQLEFIKTQFNVQDILNMFNTPVSIPASLLLASCITAHPLPSPVKSIPYAFGRGRKKGLLQTDRPALPTLSGTTASKSFHPHQDSASPLCYPIPNLKRFPSPSPYILCPLVSKHAHFFICIPSIHFLGGVSVGHGHCPWPPTPHTHALAHIATKYW